MDCATLCLLAISVGLTPSPQNQRCAYCMDVRGMTSICEEDPFKCVQFDPDSLIYCLTVNEFVYSGQVRRIVRCLSHKHFNMSSETMSHALSTNECRFENMQSCECETCTLPTTTTQSPKEFESSDEFEDETNFSGELSSARLQSGDIPDDRNQKLHRPSSAVQMHGYARTRNSATSNNYSISLIYYCIICWSLCLIFPYL